MNCTEKEDAEVNKCTDKDGKEEEQRSGPAGCLRFKDEVLLEGGRTKRRRINVLQFNVYLALWDGTGRVVIITLVAMVDATDNKWGDVSRQRTIGCCLVQLNYKMQQQ